MKNNILKSIFISLILLVGVNNAWAASEGGSWYDWASSENVYFDNTNSSYSNVSMLIGRQWNYGSDGVGSSGVNFTKVANTNNLYHAATTWNKYNTLLFMDATGWEWEGNKVTQRYTYASNYTNTNNVNINGTELFYAASNAKGAELKHEDLNGYAALNSQQTIQSVVDGTVANSKATISITSYQMTAHKTTTKQTATLGTGADVSYITAARTATTTLEVGDVATGYQFDGWYTAATGGTQLSKEKTYTYYPTAATTVYARFSAKKYNITYKDQGNVAFSGTHASGYPTTHTYGTATTLKNPTKNNYTFGGWFTSSNCSGSAISSLSATGYTADITLYAKWTINTHTVSYGVCSSTRWGSIKLNSETAITTTGTKTLNYGTAISFTATPNTGYQVVGWYSNADCTTQLQAGGNSYNAGTLTANKTVYVKFEQIPATSHNITYTPQKTGWTYDANNPTSADEGEKVSFIVTPATGYSVTVKSDVNLEKNGNTYTFEMPSKDVEIDVTATEILSTITIYATPEEAGSVLVNGQPFTAGGTVKVGIATSVEVTAVPNDGYGVAAWSRTEGVVNHLSGSNPITITTYGTGADGVLRANFIGLEYTITFNKQEGTNGTDKATVRYKNNEYSVSPVVAPTRAGYTFGGYYTQTAGAGVQVVSAEGQWLANATGYTDADRKWLVKENTTLYAKWVELPPTTIYIRSNGSYADFKWNNNAMTPMDCGGTYYTANIPASVNEITLTGSNSFTTTTLTVPTDDKVLYDLTSTNITHLYLKPNSNWKQSNARFAAYFFGNGETWVNMTKVTDDLYSVEIPTNKTYPSVIFCRMNPSSNSNGWTADTQLWNQTKDLTIPTDGTNSYTVKDGAWSKGDGTWSTIYDNSKWTTFEAPTLELRINITGKGSIVLNGETYTSDSPGTKSFTISKAISASITIDDIIPTERWEYNEDAQITMCGNTEDLAASHTINGPATINLSFTQTSCEVVFNLNLPKGVVIPSWSIANQYMDINGTATEPSVGEIGDYLFGGWYKNGSTFTDANKYDFSTPVTGDLNLYARWIPYAQCIFFKNTLSWSDVYVYTFSADAWDSYVGLKVKGKYQEYGKMTQIGQTDVYYYTLNNTTDGFSYIAFSETDMHNNNEFYGSKAIYRGDRSDQMQLFIPQTDQFPSTTNKTQYYSSGIWMKYNSTESGYKWSSDKNGWSTDVNPFTASTKGGYTFTTTVSLSGNTTYLFKINNIKNDWFGNTGTMTQDNCTKWPFTPDTDNATIKPNVTGDYVFTVYLGDGKVEVSLEYPLSVGDYRLSYYDAVTGLHPGHYIKKRNEDRRDTVSFFVHVENNPEIRLESCTAIDANTSTATWEILDQYEVLKTISANPATAMLPGKRKSDGTLYIGEGCGIDSTGVYNFILQQSNSTAEVITDETHPYEGKYYIRTDAAAGGWDSFRQAGNKMTYSSYADKNQDFDHYFCKWITLGTNIKFVIANEYSLCISDTLDGDDIVGNTGEHIGYLPADANVRFGWDGKTNKVSRAYISGAGKSQDRFLVLTGNEYLLYVNGNPIPQGTEADSRLGLNEHELLFSDKQNWIYQLDVKANSNTEITLTAQYNKETQTFFSTSKSGEVMQATNDDYHKVRMIYDFKTNNLIAAWLLDTPVQETEAESVASNMLIIRENQDDANQINFTKNQNMEIYTAYAVMTFTRDWVKGADTRDRSEYWVSFPFDVNLSDVFGFSEYGDQWIMLLYDGAERAEKGYWKETTTFWKYITNRNYTLKAGVGYVLKLNPSKMNFDYGATDVSLFFPSQGIPTVINAEPTSITVPAHECTIERDNRNIYDSHWNLIGVPGYANLENLKVDKLNQTVTIENEAHNLAFYYAYDAANNSYNTSLATATFKNMHAYMVQYAGELAWTNIQETPASIAARRNSDAEPEKAIFRLELAQGEEKADQTFVQLQQEGATADFDMNVDMTKIFNSGANIYTLVGSQCIQTAGNALPFSQTIVPVGVVIATDGEYTFRMPDGTEGMIVELIDYETNTRTNLLLNDYTVNLPVGTNEKRFAISIKPNKVATSIDSTTTPSDSNIRKFIIDGQLYLQAEGQLYDAQGKLVR